MERQEQDEQELINRFCDEVGAVRKTLIALADCNRTAFEAYPYTRKAADILVEAAEAVARAAKAATSEAKVTVRRAKEAK